MAVRRILLPWDRQPDDSAGEIDWEQPHLQMLSPAGRVRTALWAPGVVPAASSALTQAGGVHGPAVGFNGSSSYLRVKSEGNVDAAVGLTMFCLFRANTTPSTSVSQPIGRVNTGGNAPLNFSWGHSLSPFRTAWATNNGTTWTSLGYSGLIADAWYLISASASTATNGFRIFLNGQLVATTTITGFASGASDRLFIGAGSTGGVNPADYFNGSIAQAGEIGRAWSDGEHQAFANALWRSYFGRSLVVRSAVSGGTTIAPTKGTLTHTGKQPTITQTANQTVAPAKGTLTFTGYTPTVTQTANQTVAPAKGTLTFTGYTPTVTQTANQTVAPAKGTLTFTGYAPTVTQDSGTVIYPAKGTLTHTGKQPAITQTANQIIVPTKGTLTFTGKQPTVTQTGGVTYTRAPRGAGYPGARPAIERYGMTNTSRPATTNTRR